MLAVMKVLLVDDEKVVLTVSKQALDGVAEGVTACTDPREALKTDLRTYDVILSDYYMPGMKGDEFLREVRKAAPEVPFVFLTQNEDLAVAVELMRQGADDYVSKPIQPANFVFRIRKVIHEKEQQRQIRQILEEQKLLDLENRKLANWRVLYASKDARQTEMLVSNLSRNINQSGGFLWVDLLASSLVESDEDTYTVPRGVMEMALNAARNQETLFKQVTYIGTLDEVELEMQTLSGHELYRSIEGIVEDRILPILNAHDRTLRWCEKPPAIPRGGKVTVDLGKIADILLELTINAIKFSPPSTPVGLDLVYQADRQTEMLTLQVSSYARRLQASDEDGNHIYGIPYDYTELVFDLFFTIEAFPEYLPEEEWTDGSGLYIARKLMTLMNGWIAAQSGIDYTAPAPQPLVRMDVRMPVIRE